MVNGWTALLAAVLLGSGSGFSPPGGRLENRTLAAPSLHDPVRDCRVYLPPSYEMPGAAGRRYPVIVFLHGWPGSEGNWPGEGRLRETLDRLIRIEAIPELIGLFPDGSGSGHLGRSMWLNAVDGGSQMEDFLTRDLLAWADSTLRTVPTARMRGVIGLSDGGTGAMHLALRHPDVYGAAGAHSGGYRLRPDWSSGPLFGSGPRADSLRAAYSPIVYLPQLAERERGLVIYFDCGRGDAARRENLELDSLMTALHVPHEFHEFHGGHGWGYWRAHIEESLRAVTARMRDGGW